MSRTGRHSFTPPLLTPSPFPFGPPVRPPLPPSRPPLPRRPVGAEAEDAKITLLLKELEGKNITDIIAKGATKLASVSAAAPAGAAPAAAAPAAHGKEAAKPKKEEKKEEEADEVRPGRGERPSGRKRKKVTRAVAAGLPPVQGYWVPLFLRPLPPPSSLRPSRSCPFPRRTWASPCSIKRPAPRPPLPRTLPPAGERNVSSPRPAPPRRRPARRAENAARRGRPARSPPRGACRPRGRTGEAAATGFPLAPPPPPPPLRLGGLTPHGGACVVHTPGSRRGASLLLAWSDSYFYYACPPSRADLCARPFAVRETLNRKSQVSTSYRARYRCSSYYRSKF